MDKLKLYGNLLWNNNTQNEHKKVLTADEDKLSIIIELLEAAGLNYCAYSRKNNSFIAVNTSDIDKIMKLDIPIQSIIDSNNKVYQPKSIIGNTQYHKIINKQYRKYDVDLSYKVAQRLYEHNIPYQVKYPIILQQ